MPSKREISLIGAIDQGTSSSRFLIFEPSSAKLVAHHQIEVTRNCPRQGWVEEDANILLQTVLTCVEETVKQLKDLGFQISDIKAIGVANQRQTVVIWDKETGEPLHPAILWCDTRTADMVHEILQRPKETNADIIKSISGLPIITFTSALKIKWLLENVADVQRAVADGRCLVGTVDSWIIWNITGGKTGGTHITDVSNASTTQLMNLTTLQWDPILCDFFNVPCEILPTIKSSSEIYGCTKIAAMPNVPISGCLGDQQAALVGQMCFQPGQAKCTYGTGCFLVCNTGNKMILSKHGLLTMVGYKLGPNSPPVYILEGSIAVAGAGIRWLRDNLGISSTYEELDVMASKVPNSGGVYFVPAFSGLFSPYWRPDARGIICGITEYTTKDHIARAAFEAVSFQVRDVVETVNKEGCPLESLKVDGGMSKNDMFMKLQSDILGIELHCPKMAETTALGVAIAAGLADGINLWNLTEHSLPSGDEEKVFRPTMLKSERDSVYWRWKRAVSRSFGWESSENSQNST